MSRLRPTPALVVATIALIVALGGTSYAAFSLPQNSVGTKQLKKRAVTGAKLANGAVTAAKVARNSLTGAQINAATLGTVPSAAAAARAAHAATADNASELGGKPASAFQARVASCSGDTAIQTVAADGTVTCNVPVPAGSAGGALAGSYPSPTLAPGAVTPAVFGTIPAARIELDGDRYVFNNSQTNVEWYDPSCGNCFDNDNLYDGEDIPVQYTTLRAPISGLYEVNTGIDWEPNATGQRFLAIGLDGGCCAAGSWINATGGGADTIQTVSDLLQLSAGEHVYASVIQTSGASLLMRATSGTYMAMHWVSP